MGRKYWFVSLFLSLSALSATDHAPRDKQFVSTLVRNGTEDTDGKYPLVGMFTGSKSVCSGTVLSELPCVVLTAEHCKDATDNTFQIGDSKAKVASFTPVPADPGTKDGAPDIAIVVLDHQFEIPEGVSTKLAKKAIEPEKVASLTIVGYGQSKGKSDLFKKRQYGRMKPLRFTRGKVGVQISLTPIPADNNSLCGGDSGGPTMNGDEIVGVNSRTEPQYPHSACVSPLGDKEVAPKTAASGIDFHKDSKLVWLSATRLEVLRYALSMIHAKVTDADQLELNVANSWHTAKLLCEFLNEPKGKMRAQVETNLKALYKSGDEKISKEDLDDAVKTILKEADDASLGRKTWRLPFTSDVRKSPGSWGYLRGGAWVGDDTEMDRKHAAFRGGETRTLHAIPTDCDLSLNSHTSSVPHHLKQIEALLADIRKKGCPAEKLELPAPPVREEY